MSVRTLKLSLFLFACSLTGQMPGFHNVSGEIVPAGRSSIAASRLMLELRDLSDSTRTQRVLVQSDGTFELRDVKNGHYQVAVTDLHGEIVQQEMAEIVDGAPLVVRLAAERGSVAPAGVVSVAALNSKAAKEFARARKAAEAGDTAKTIEFLEKAIEISPAFKEAYNNLGASYMGLKKYDQGARAFQKAVELDPTYSAAWRNLSVAWFRLGRLEEAEAAARHLVELPGDSPVGHYLLGVALVGQQKYTPEALDALLSTTNAFPAARLLATEVLIRQGRTEEAVSELHTFLNVGQPKVGP